MRSGIRAVTALLAGLLSSSASPCGVCIEDKIASTYDHAVVLRAADTNHVMVFGEVAGAADPAVLTREIARAARSVRGIDRRSVRASASPAAFSFALDPSVQSASAAVRDMERRLRSKGVALTVLRVICPEREDRQSAGMPLSSHSDQVR